ncbi:MAG: flagellar FliJ family protein [Armatimonadota bacterium]|nr:flagellar FliJ family protein [Armatimonadota bacterium]
MKYRRSRESECRAEVAVRRDVVRQARTRLLAARRELTAFAERPAPGRAPAAQLTDAQHYLQRLRREVARAESHLQRCRTALEEAREALTRAGQDRLAIERLLEAERAEARERLAAARQQQLDAHGRRRALSGGDGRGADGP